jgi:hypothetical protein
MVLDLAYVLPFRSSDEESLDSLTEYLTWLAPRVDVIVVDGSDARVFAENHRVWGSLVTHIAVREGLAFKNGKVSGVTTGIEYSRREKVIVADDDVRYDQEGLERMGELLEAYDLVRPQNYFDPSPWHALWDSGRTLLNRAVSADYPGTLGLRREMFVAAGGYDGDVMFENLELIRTIEVAGGTCLSAPDLYVRRVPPSTRRFLSQRSRQAYDDLAQPVKAVAFLAFWPVLKRLQHRRRWWALTVVACGAVIVAEKGRRSHGGTRLFSPVASAAAPLWLLERASFIWVALAQRMTGGVRYRGERILVAANRKSVIRRRLEGQTNHWVR